MSLTFFFLQKTLLFPFSPRYGRGLQGGYRDFSGFMETLRQKKPDTRKMQSGPSKFSGLQGLLIMFEDEPLEEIYVQPSLGASQPTEVGQMVAHLFDEFHLLI